MFDGLYAIYAFLTTHAHPHRASPTLVLKIAFPALALPLPNPQLTVPT